MQRKGFTLVELMGVIAVLGVIALITVPVIRDMINDAKKKAFINNTYSLVRAANLYYSRQEMLGENLKEKIFNFPDNAEELKIEGQIPKEGSIIISKEGFVALAVVDGEYCIKKEYDEHELTILDDYKRCNNPEIPLKLSEIVTTSEEVTSVPVCITDGTICTAGTLVALEVNDDEIYNFYIISEIEGQVTLIMDRNIGNKVAWVSKEDYNDDTNYGIDGNNNKGPITVLNYLNSQTENWTNISPIENYKYDNNLNGTTNTYGYQKLEITKGTGVLTSQDGTETNTLVGTSRARLITLEEVKALQTANSNVTPTYLYANLYNSINTSLPYGYLFLTTDPSNYRYIYLLHNDSSIKNYHVHYAFYGIRPIITLHK